MKLIMESWRNFMVEQGGVPSAPNAGAPMLSGVQVHGTSPSRIPVARDIVPARALTKWEKFVRFLGKIPGPGKKLFAIFSAGSLAAGAKAAYTEGYGSRPPGIISLIDFSASEGIIEAIPVAGEIYTLVEYIVDKQSDDQ